jgi:hypothetical protein
MKLERHFSSAVNVTAATSPFAQVPPDLAVQLKPDFTAIIGPKHAEFALKSWNLWGILRAAKPRPWLAGRPEFDENHAFKSKSRSIPAARSDGNDVG